MRRPSRVLDDDFALVLVQPAPAVMPRSRWLEVLPDYVVDAYDVEEAHVDVDGDTAAVLQRVRMTATVLGQDRSGVFVMSDIWRRGPDGWRVWRRHSSRSRPDGCRSLTVPEVETDAARVGGISRHSAAPRRPLSVAATRMNW